MQNINHQLLTLCFEVRLQEKEPKKNYDKASLLCLFLNIVWSIGAAARGDGLIIWVG